MKDFYSSKLHSAATMVDKMSKFSRGFISLNSLSQIILKNRQRVLAKSLIRWSKFNKPSPSAADPSIVYDLQQKLKEKDAEMQKMEHMFREYSSWRAKLEQIEVKMRQDVDFWKVSCDKLQKENEKLQKETLKATQ